MILNSLIQYQPRCTSYYNNFIAFCTQTDTSKRVILCESNQNNAVEHNLDIYDDGLMELKFVETKEGVLLILLTETKLKGYSMQGKVVYNYERIIEEDLAEFQDRFVACAVYNQFIHIITEQGNIFRLNQNKLETVIKIQAKCVTMISYDNILIISAQNSKIFAIRNLVLVQLLTVPSDLPIYFINSINDHIILGSISGQLFITKLVNQTLQIVCKIQAHVGLMTCLETINNLIFTGSDDGFVNRFSFSQEKLSLVKSSNLNRIITGIFLNKSKGICSVYESNELFEI